METTVSRGRLKWILMEKRDDDTMEILLLTLPTGLHLRMDTAWYGIGEFAVSDIAVVA